MLNLDYCGVFVTTWQNHITLNSNNRNNNNNKWINKKYKRKGRVQFGYSPQKKDEGTSGSGQTCWISSRAGLWFWNTKLTLCVLVALFVAMFPSGIMMTRTATDTQRVKRGEVFFLKRADKRIIFQRKHLQARTAPKCIRPLVYAAADTVNSTDSCMNKEPNNNAGLLHYCQI